MYERTLFILTLLHPERPKLYTILVFLGAIGLMCAHTSGYIYSVIDKDYNLNF